MGLCYGSNAASQRHSFNPTELESSEEFFNQDRTWDEGPLAEKAAYVQYSISDFREGDYIAKFKFV